MVVKMNRVQPNTTHATDLHIMRIYTLPLLVFGSGAGGLVALFTTPLLYAVLFHIN
jgi:hypothetical protein